MNEPSNKIRVALRKSAEFRTIHANGAFGGTTPHADLMITFYTERFPIPNVLTYDITPSGLLGNERIEERESKEGIIREIETAIVLDLPTAQSFAQWLTDKVAELQQQQRQIGAQLPKEIEK